VPGNWPAWFGGRPMEKDPPRAPRQRPTRLDGRAEETHQAQHNLHNKGVVPAWQSMMAQVAGEPWQRASARPYMSGLVGRVRLQRKALLAWDNPLCEERMSEEKGSP